jgi:hypothetical protein
LTRDLETKWKSEPPGKTFKQTNQYTRVHSSAFEQNIKIYLASQQCGGGLHDSRVLGGMLGLHSNPLKNAWYRISQTVGLSILELGKEILEENREVEKGLSPVADEKYDISLCGEMLGGTRGVVGGTTPRCPDVPSPWAVVCNLPGTSDL